MAEGNVSGWHFPWRQAQAIICSQLARPLCHAWSCGGIVVIASWLTGVTMKRALATIVAVVFLLTGTGCGQSQASISVEELEYSIWVLVNQERANEGLSLLSKSEDLGTLARQYAEARFSDEEVECGDIRYLRSNSWSLDYNGGTPQLDHDNARDQVAYCLEQPDLRENMLRPEARSTGVGIAVIGDAVYYTQVFDVVNLVGGGGQPIVLDENPEATDPSSWEELEAFLETDNTDEITYEPGSFICTDFAETLHNNAEEAGIRAAYVSVGFNTEPGHALNAFSIDDQTVYIDVISSDKVAYVQVGGEYGLIRLDVATQFSYSYFEDVQACIAEREQYDEDLQRYEQAVEEYNERGETELFWSLIDPFKTLPEFQADLQARDQAIEQEEASLGLTGSYWNALGSLVGVDDPTVVDFYVHW